MSKLTAIRRSEIEKNRLAVALEADIPQVDRHAISLGAFGDERPAACRIDRPQHRVDSVVGSIGKIHARKGVDEHAAGKDDDVQVGRATGLEKEATVRVGGGAPEAD